MGLRNTVEDLNPRNEPSLNAEDTLRLFREKGCRHVQSDDEWKPGMVIAAIIPDNIRSSWFADDPPGKRPSIAVFTDAVKIRTNTRPGVTAFDNAESVGFFAIDPATHRFFLSASKPFDFNEKGEKAERPYGTNTEYVFLFKDREEWQRFINWPKGSAWREEDNKRKGAR